MHSRLRQYVFDNSSVISFVGYILAGFVQKWYVVLPVMAVVTVAVLFVIKSVTKNKMPVEAKN